MTEKSTSFTELVKKWLECLADWIQENLGDPAIAAALRDDLRLAPGKDIPKAEVGKIQQLADGFDPDKTSFKETIKELKDIIDALEDLFTQIGSGDVSGWDAAYIAGKVAASESIRVRLPLIYAIGKATLFISDDPEQVSEFDPAKLVNIVNGDMSALGDGEAWVQRLTSSASLLTMLLEALLEKPLGSNFLEAYYGWDPVPGSITPNADRVSGRALTYLLQSQADAAGKLAVTILGVPPEHSGPAIFIAVGGSLSATQEDSSVEYKLEAGASDGMNFFIPFSKTAHPFEFSGNPQGFVRLSALRKGASDAPAFRIGDAGKTRLDIGSLGIGIDLLPNGAGFRFFFKNVALVINIGEGDGFLQQLPLGEIKLSFNLNVSADTVGGLRVDGGTLLRATLPVDRAVGGFLNVYHIDLQLGPGASADGRPGYDASLEMSTAFGLNLGPFRVSVDRIGFQFNFAFRKGNLGFLDADLGFKPPNGLGLVLDAGIVKGGGYLFFDHQRGEYAGALELKFAAYGLKAIGILSTHLPDGSPGFALLLLIYADLPRFHIAFGIFFEGVGGILGLQHGVSLQALQEGIPTGLFDDLLFPANPVADAPRIINRLRVIFPIRQYAFLIGPVFRLTWGTPAVGEIKLGLILAMDNVLGGDRPLSLSSIVLLGQLRIGLPDARSDKVVRIICDFMGYLDFDNKRFGFYARLRNSRLIDILELTGSLVLQIDFGDHPSFVVAAGGFHPRFRDLPAGLPSRLDRIGLRFDITIVKVSIQFYIAVTSATVQFGAELRLNVKLGPVTIEGWLGFDALIYYQPYFRFETDFRVGMTIKVEGFTLMGVSVEGMLAGPGQWHITGRAKFSILFWDFEKSFDERWGDEPALPATSTNVAALMTEAYANPDNWSAQLPAGMDTLVTLSARKGNTQVLAHPLGQLRVSQKIAPLGLSLEKWGETRVEGPNRFDLQSVTIGGTVVNNPEFTTEHLARATYVNLNEEQRLTQPSFETFNVGVVVGAGRFSVPAAEAVDGDLTYETSYLEPGLDEADGGLPTAEGVLTAALVSIGTINASMLDVHAQMGAAAQALIRVRDRLMTEAVQKVVLDEPKLAVVDQDALRQVDDLFLTGLEQTNFSIASQKFAAIAGSQSQIVEAFELP